MLRRRHQAALLGLLALLLSFTFAMAVGRFDLRKSLVLDEANAIGTTYLRAKMLSPERREQVASLLKTYVRSRLQFYDAGIDEERFEAANAEAAAIQEQLWALALSSVAEDPRSVPAGLFAESLNEMIDLSEKRRAALENRVPESVLYLLFAVAAGALGFIAYGAGLSSQRRIGATATFALLISVVLMITLDIDRPRRGLVLVSQSSMMRVQSYLEQDAPAAPNAPDVGSNPDGM